MAQTCSRCSRPNPAEASFCHFDGALLANHAPNRPAGSPETQPFPRPFVFPSGQSCNNFEELALGCQQNWAEAREMVRQGFLEGFLGGLGRADLALAAREAARFPDPDRGFDQFLARLPGKALMPPTLRVEPLQVDLGRIPLGEDRQFDLLLKNQGMRLLFGTITCADCSWLALGGGAGAAEKLFEFGTETIIPVQVRGRGLRAGNKPFTGHLQIESNGGSVTVLVSVEVPVKPFPRGCLAGAVTPRQLAEKAKATPKEAAVLLEEGAVAAWYKENGWTYPVSGPAASGVAAVQQFFEVLGLASPPKVEIRERSIFLQGDLGTKVSHTLEITSEEKRPVYAHGVSDQSWLQVGRSRLEGRRVFLPLVVSAVEGQPGETLRAEVTVTANGKQRFVVPVTLVIGERPVAVEQAPLAPRAIVATQPTAGPRRLVWLALLPLGLLALALGLIVGRDFLLGVGAAEQAPEEDRGPRLAVRFHDGKKGDILDQLVPPPSMRFGLLMLKATDRHGQPRRLTVDDMGRTNNTCLRIDGTERLFGTAPGRWRDTAVSGWQDDQGRQHDGVKSVWTWDDKKVVVTQMVEVVPGEQTGILDTCLVRYMIENQDRAPHQVGLRVLLDTYIGGNDGVPFTIPGESRLCDDKMDFNTPDKVPDFIQALETEDLAHPGTVAHLKLKLGGKEGPSRVTLGAWPDDALQKLLPVPQARGPNTLWDVPVLSMKTLWPYDSAVVIYWNEKPLPAGGRREVGFAYGLGSVSSSGKLLVALDGSFKPGGQITVTALVREPAAGETVTLTVPEGFTVEGSATQSVPAVPASAASRNSPVTWKVKSGPVGAYQMTVSSSTGASRTQAVEIRARSIFD